jgi:glutathione synthase/RimK-type ligase-like ATP-grasp enzyme
MRLRVATCTTLPEPDVDEAPLAAALAAAGFDAQLVAWDDPLADWDAPIPTILRSTWNYALQLDAFLAWIDRASAAAPLANPPDIVRANVHKRYLVELAARGVPVVPTTLVERGATFDLGSLAATRVVIKPAIGAGSLDACVFAPGDPEATAHLARLTTRGAALVQPYLASVDGYGERSLIWIDGALTHAIRKARRLSGDAEQITGPFPIADDERSVADAALAPYADRLLYGRVDVARDDADRPVVMELELVEPSLFFARHAPSLDRYVAALRRWLERAG